MTHFLFARPVFTARAVARVVGRKLDRHLAYAEGDEQVDGCVEVTPRVHIQVGGDYLAVCAWADATTLRGWPPRRNIPWAVRDLEAALAEYPEPDA